MKHTDIKITDYHRQVVARYYTTIIDRYGLDCLLRHIEKIKAIVWTKSGLSLLERRTT